MDSQHNPILPRRRGRPRSSGSSSSSSISRGRSPSPLAIVPYSGVDIGTLLSPAGFSSTLLSPAGVSSGTPHSSGGVSSGTLPSASGGSGNPFSRAGVSSGTLPSAGGGSGNPFSRAGVSSGTLPSAGGGSGNPFSPPGVSSGTLPSAGGGSGTPLSPAGGSGNPLSPAGVSSGTPHSSGGVSGTLPSACGVSGTLPSAGGVTDEIPKRRRGRPRGSQNKKKKVEEGVGVGFKVHIFTIHAGQDICSAIEAFALQGRCRVIVISATGSVCYVTLLQQDSGESVVYEGNFNILMLGCSVGESGVSGFNLLMSGSTGAVYGGEVVGSSIIAASPIQVVLGTFLDEVKKPPSNVLASSSGEDQKGKQPEASSSAPLLFDTHIQQESSPSQSLSPSNMLNLTSSEDRTG